MNEAQTPERPDEAAQRVLNPDGTTNWVVVFEDPEQGILAAVASAGSVRQLQAVMTNVALLLFKRKRDAGPRAEFLAGIESILEEEGAEDFEAARARIIDTLNAEKRLRIEKAALHAKNKSITQSIEKRRASTQETAFEAFIGNPLLLGGAVAGVLGVIAVLAGLILLPTGAPEEAGTTATGAPQVSDAKDAPATSGTETATPPSKARPTPPQTEMVAMKPILSEVLSNGARRRLSMVPLMSIDKDDKIGEICSMSPWIIEGVLLRMGAALEAGKNADDALISRVAAEVNADINSRSRGIKIKNLALVDLRKLPRDVVLAANRGCGRVAIEALP